MKGLNGHVEPNVLGKQVGRAVDLPLGHPVRERLVLAEFRRS